MNLVSDAFSFLGLAGEEEDQPSSLPSAHHGTPGNRMSRRLSADQLNLNLQRVSVGLPGPHSAVQEDGVGHLPVFLSAVSERQPVRRIASDVKNINSSREKEDASFLDGILSFIRGDEDEVPASQRVFGCESIEDLPVRYDLPTIVAACLEYLYENESFKEEGLFRIGGSVANIRQLKEELTEVGEDIVIDEEMVPNPHDVTGLLKSFFKELQEPLLTHQLYQGFMTAKRTIKDKEELQSRLAQLVSQLPNLNRMVLKRVLYFVRYTSMFEKINRMGITNLATTLGPTLLSRQDDLANVSTSVALMVALLNGFDCIFGEYRCLPFEFRIADVVVRTPCSSRPSSPVQHQSSSSPVPMPPPLNLEGEEEDSRPAPSASAMLRQMEASEAEKEREEREARQKQQAESQSQEMKKRPSQEGDRGKRREPRRGSTSRVTAPVRATAGSVGATPARVSRAARAPVASASTPKPSGPSGMARQASGAGMARQASGAGMARRLSSSGASSGAVRRPSASGASSGAVRRPSSSTPGSAPPRTRKLTRNRRDMAAETQAAARLVAASSQAGANGGGARQERGAGATPGGPARAKSPTPAGAAAASGPRAALRAQQSAARRVPQSQPSAPLSQRSARSGSSLSAARRSGRPAPRSAREAS